jgi:TRAP-type C4-dicarboxylate transport system substrate-binding protein
MSGASLPFLFANAKGGSAAIDAWYRQYAAKEMKDTHFCFAFVHDPGSFHSAKKKITLPSDVRGLKVRPATSTIAHLITQLGGTNVQASAPEAATRSSAASPTRSPSRGARSRCSASTR